MNKLNKILVWTGVGLGALAGMISLGFHNFKNVTYVDSAGIVKEIGVSEKRKADKYLNEIIIENDKVKCDDIFNYMDLYSFESKVALDNLYQLVYSKYYKKIDDKLIYDRFYYKKDNLDKYKKIMYNFLLNELKEFHNFSDYIISNLEKKVEEANNFKEFYEAKMIEIYELNKSKPKIEESVFLEFRKHYLSYFYYSFLEPSIKETINSIKSLRKN
ncbi:MAG: hypothetical protein QXR30_04375 [Candidatus Woesearchaeota archaeon]